MDAPPTSDALEKVNVAMTASELRAAALSSLQTRRAVLSGGGSDVTAIYESESAKIAGELIEQGELVDHISDGLPLEVGRFGHGSSALGPSASSRPDEDFEALLLQYQNSASGSTSTPEQAIVAAGAHGEMPDRSSYYDYDSGRVIYGVDRYSSPTPASSFAGGVGQADANVGYYYQGAQWPIPGLSYFSGSMPPQPQHQSDQSTFHMLNQYHMQLRMLMSASPRQSSAQRLDPAESFAPERFGQQIYPPSLSLPAVPPPLPQPSHADCNNYGATAYPSAGPVYRPTAQRPTVDDGLLSDGELESFSDEYEHGCIGSTAAIAAAGVGGIEIASQQGAHQDVEGAAKERINQMLRMKDPKLLQSSAFRALMLLLKCIRLDDPDVIYATVKAAPTQVISELNVLSAEFGLGMITEACVTTLLADDTGSLHANLKLGAAEAVAMAEAGTGSSVTPLAAQQRIAGSAQSQENSWAHVPVSDSETAEMETRPTSGGNESSTPDSDMDTSSDVDYEDQPSQPRPPMFDNQSTGSRSSVQPMPALSRETTPQFHARFSRSRAPSPPSAQPRTPRRLSYARRSPTPSGHDGRGGVRTGGSALSLHSGLNISNSHLFSGADNGWRVYTQLSREATEPAQNCVESAVCTSEADPLVVYLDDSDSQSDTDSCVDSEDDCDSEQRARDRARRQENRKINKECIRLAQEDGQLTGYGYDGLARSSAASSLSGPRVPTPGGLARPPSEALLKTKENIRTQEAAIARLKMEISRKQTKMLLRKKLYESKLKRANTGASAHTAPATPYADEESEDAGPEQSTENSLAFPKSTSSLSLSSASESCPSGLEHGEIPADVSQSAPCSPGRKATAVARVGSSMDLGVAVTPPDSARALPECGPCEQMILQASPETRSAHISNIMVLLKGAIQSKNSELRSIMRGASSVPPKDLDKLRKSALQNDERLLARQTKLEEQRASVSKRISELQAELGLVDMELGILSYSQAASRGYRAMIDPAGSSGCAPSTAATGSRAVSLRNDITAVHQFMDLMFRAADTSVEATASDNDLALQASKMAIVPASQSAAATGLPLSAPPRSQRELGELRAKLVAMKKTQVSASQKSTQLAGKRNGSESRELDSRGTKRSRADPSSAPSTSAALPSSATEPPYTTSVAELLAATNQAAAAAGEKSTLKWRNLLRLPVDECTIQPLVIVDGVGLQNVTSLSEGLLSGIASSRLADAHVAVARLQPRTHDSPCPTASTPAYVPYQSPLGATAGASAWPRPKSSATDLGEQSLVDSSVDLSKVSTTSLFGLVKSWPKSNPRVSTLFHADIVQALELVETAPDGTAPNGVIAKALVPVVAGYIRMIPNRYVQGSCALAQALRVGSKPKPEGLFVPFAGGKGNEALQIKDISNLKRLVAEVAQFVPILNRDVARMSYSSLAIRHEQRQRPATSGPLRRYFHVGAAGEDQSAIPGPASDDEDDGPGVQAGSAEDSITRMDGVEPGDNDGESETEAASADDGPEARYRHALRLLWRGCPITGSRINETHVLSYLHSSANKSLGKALVYLKQSLQLYPRSEKLWDLCLELFARQPVPAQEIMAAFHDATQFNPRSTFLWQRYMHWCNWCIAHNVDSLGDCAVWLSRLSTMTLSAVRSHVDQLQSSPSEHVSASLTKIILYFWEGLWALLELRVTLSAQSRVVVKSALLKSQLISRMGACLWAKTPMALYTQISGTTEGGNLQGGANTSSDELALGSLLLPHHFMYVGQVFLSCFVSGLFVPRSVLASICASLTTSPGHAITAHYLSPKMIADMLPASLHRDGTLEQHIIDVISRFFAALIAIVHSHDLAKPANPLSPEFVQSGVICDASINLTLAQLEQCLPAGSPSLCNGSEAPLYRVSRDSLGDIEHRGLLAQTGSLGNDMFLLMTRILPKCELDRNIYTSCERVVHILREHALVVAKSLGVAPSTSQIIPWYDPVVNDTRSVLKRLQRRILDCRALYYLIIGYSGPAQPTSAGALALGLLDREEAGTSDHGRVLRCSSLWINVAIVELLSVRLAVDSRSVDAQAVESALAWLNYGMEHYVRGQFSARVQMWTVILQVTMTMRSLTLKDIVRVHRDLGYDADPDSLHSPVTDYAPINSVLGPVIRTASGITLEAIAGYLTYIGYRNTELAFRLIVHASTLDKTTFGLCGLFQHIQSHNAMDPLIAEIGLIIEETKLTLITFENMDYEDDEDDEDGEDGENYDPKNDEDYDVFVYVFFGTAEQIAKLEKAAEEEGCGAVFDQVVASGNAYIEMHDKATSSTAFAKLVGCPIM